MFVLAQKSIQNRVNRPGSGFVMEQIHKDCMVPCLKWHGNLSGTSVPLSRTVIQELFQNRHFSCKQKANPVWFSCRNRSYPESTLLSVSCSSF